MFSQFELKYYPINYISYFEFQLSSFAIKLLNCNLNISMFFEISKT